MGGSENGGEASSPGTANSGSEKAADAATREAMDLGKVRELVLAAHPDVIPELVAGDSFEALMASVEPAKAAYQRIVERVGQQAQTAGAGVTVSAGQPGRRFVVNIEELSSEQKIAEGLRMRKART